MKYIAILLLILSCRMTRADDVGLWRIKRVDPKRYETVYTTSKLRAEQLASHDNYEIYGLVGIGTDVTSQGKIQIYEAYRDGWHVYYTEMPDGHRWPTGTKVKALNIWVWKRRLPGLVPVYGVSDQNWRNMRFTTDRDQAKNEIETRRRVKGEELKDHDVMFYIKPAPEKEAADE